MGEIVMKKLHRLFSFVVSLLMTINVFAQSTEMTPYETKRDQLVNEGLLKLMNTMSSYDKALFAVGMENVLKDAHEEGDIFTEMAIKENILIKLCDLGEGLQTEANVMADSFDIRDVYTGQMLLAWQDIGQWYIEERIKLEDDKTDIDIQRENERARKTGIPGVKQRVKRDYIRWARKGEFEKTAAYNERLSQRGNRIFDSLCFIHFNEALRTEMRIMSIGQYDADREGLPLRFYYGDEGKEHAYVDAFWNITPEQANKGGRVFWEKGYAKGMLLNDGYLFPAFYNISDSNEQEYIIKVGTPETVSLSMEEVLGSNYTQKDDHLFDYSAYSLSLVSRKELYRMIYKVGVEAGYDTEKNALVYKGIPFDGRERLVRGNHYSDVVPDIDYDQLLPKEDVAKIMGRVKAYYAHLSNNSIYKKLIDTNPDLVSIMTETELADFRRLCNNYPYTSGFEIEIFLEEIRNKKADELCNTIKQYPNWSGDEESKKIVESSVSKAIQCLKDPNLNGITATIQSTYCSQVRQVIVTAFEMDSKLQKKYMRNRTPEEAWEKYSNSR